MVLHIDTDMYIYRGKFGHYRMYAPQPGFQGLQVSVAARLVGIGRKAGRTYAVCPALVNQEFVACAEGWVDVHQIDRLLPFLEVAQSFGVITVIHQV